MADGPPSQSSIDALNSATSNLADLYICHRHGKGVQKETKRFGAFKVFGVLARMLADVQVNTGSSNVHVQWFAHQKIRADDYDVIM